MSSTPPAPEYTAAMSSTNGSEVIRLRCSTRRWKPVREMIDNVAERISTLGGSPQGTRGVLVAERSWDDYTVGRAETIEHLGALDLVHTRLVEDHRDAERATEEPDPVTQDLLIEDLRSLGLFQWFVRAHLESVAGGRLSTADAGSEREAASQAGEQARNQP